jgi:hypothetical protein
MPANEHSAITAILYFRCILVKWRSIPCIRSLQSSHRTGVSAPGYLRDGAQRRTRIERRNIGRHPRHWRGCPPSHSLASQPACWTSLAIHGRRLPDGLPMSGDSREGCHPTHSEAHRAGRGLKGARRHRGLRRRIQNRLQAAGAIQLPTSGRRYRADRGSNQIRPPPRPDGDRAPCYVRPPR